MSSSVANEKAPDRHPLVSEENGGLGYLHAHGRAQSSGPQWEAGLRCILPNGARGACDVALRSRAARRDLRDAAGDDREEGPGEGALKVILIFLFILLAPLHDLPVSKSDLVGARPR